MNRIVMAAALLACACSPLEQEKEGAPAIQASAPELLGVTLPVSDLAGNTMQALAQAGDRWCTEDNAWCVTLPKGAPPSATHGVKSTTLTISGDGELSAWPVAIRTTPTGATYLGLVQSVEQPFSGGGASAARLTLYELTESAAGLASRPVATLPLSGSAMIRACFDEDDERQRAGACHDEYSFVTRITLDEGVSSGAPRILLETAAGTYPGHVSRRDDSLQAPPLQQSDLVWANDDRCTYRRAFVRGNDGLYTPEQPLPDCNDYLEP